MRTPDPGAVVLRGQQAAWRTSAARRRRRSWRACVTRPWPGGPG